MLRTAPRGAGLAWMGLLLYTSRLRARPGTSTKLRPHPSSPGPYLLAATVKAKARANLEASKILLQAKLFDPAMSRLYYALFQAAVHIMGSKGKRPRDLSEFDEWKHAVICSNTFLLRGRRDDRRLFSAALGLREQADYKLAPVKPEQVHALVEGVEEFVNGACT